MKLKCMLFVFSIVLVSSGMLAQDGLVIQESTPGVCTMDGTVDSAAIGFTGIGYANIDNGLGIGMSWSINVDTAGIYPVYWRYALGGSDQTSRDAKLLINEIAVGDTVEFPYTGDWTQWEMTDTFYLDLESGSNKVRLKATTIKGLANLDYFHILGPGISPSVCLPSYIFSINPNDAIAGSVSYLPVQEYYDKGTEITVNAVANTGYFFHSWSGEQASTDSYFTFQIAENTDMTALFYEDGTSMVPDVAGYATVQHDNGTPYMLVGGSLGETVEANSIEDLKKYLEDEKPYVVQLSEHVTGDSKVEIKINSNKTFIGMNDKAHLEGIKVAIHDCRNVIVKNITLSMVYAGDEIEINSSAKNIWIDGCEFFTRRESSEDEFDGCIDIKNESSFITVSWCHFHDHNKTILISSGDNSFQDSIQRITFHHNYFHNCNSRMPSIRFGKSHIFNNMYEKTSTAINTRMNACVRVENNYFLNAGQGVGMLYSAIPGKVELMGNIFENTSHSSSPGCELEVPYEYAAFLDNAADLPTLIPGKMRKAIVANRVNLKLVYESNYGLHSYPNPAEGSATVAFTAPNDMDASIVLYNMLGHKIKILANGHFAKGRYEIHFPITGLTAGVYFYQLKTDEVTITRRMIVKE